MDIIVAARRGDLARLRALVERDDWEVRPATPAEKTAMLLAARGGHVEVVRYLLDRNVNASQRGYQGVTALHLASMCGHAAVVRLLLESGADTTPVDVQGNTALMFAASGGHEAVVGVLLGHGGSDVDAASHMATHEACHHGSSDVVRQLLVTDVDPTLRTTDGRTALDIAVLYQHKDCVRVLQEWERAYMLHRARYIPYVAASSAST